MEEKKKRPNIPQAIQRELWIKSGGRCEFRGCNKYLYKDGVTQQPRNLANIAHIISWTPTGPRGNQDSERLATDISNLMLTCSEHNNLIDNKQYVEEYPVELLQQYKREHEERIFRVTGMGQDYGVRIIKMISKIQNQVPVIGEKMVSEAIKPYYPMESDIVIDLTQIENIESAQRQIERTVDLHIMSGEKEEIQSEEINLLIEVSGKIDRNLLPNNLTYSVQAEKPGFLFVQNQKQMLEFQIKFRELLNDIRVVHGEVYTINLVIAAPNPISFEKGSKQRMGERYLFTFRR